MLEPLAPAIEAFNSALQYNQTHQGVYDSGDLCRLMASIMLFTMNARRQLFFDEFFEYIAPLRQVQQYHRLARRQNIGDWLIQAANRRNLAYIKLEYVLKQQGSSCKDLALEGPIQRTYSDQLAEQFLGRAAYSHNQLRQINQVLRDPSGRRPRINIQNFIQNLNQDQQRTVRDFLQHINDLLSNPNSQQKRGLSLEGNAGAGIKRIFKIKLLIITFRKNVYN